MAHQCELTISDALRDPIIREVLRADGMSLSDFAMLLQEAARRQHEKTVRLDSQSTTHVLRPEAVSRNTSGVCPSSSAT